MKRTIGILVLIFAISSLFPQGDSFQVIAKSGLIVRDEPSRSGERIAKLPYLSEVKIMEVTDQQAEIEDGGSLKKGNWVKIAFGQGSNQVKGGYVFDAYLRRKGDFILIIPDTVRLKKQVYAREYAGSLAYIYLKTYYEKASPQKPLEYFGGDTEKVCSFRQEFKQEISYYHWDCRENGANESITFPKMELKEVKEWLETLFYDKANSWTSDYNYEADGVGCYYEIKQTDRHTIIEISCGC